MVILEVGGIHVKTIIRLLIIAGIISFIRGPLNTYRSNHPKAWAEGMATIQTIPKVVGQMLNREVSFISNAQAPTPKKGDLASPPSPSKKGAIFHSFKSFSSSKELPETSTSQQDSGTGNVAPSKRNTSSTQGVSPTPPGNLNSGSYFGSGSGKGNPPTLSIPSLLSTVFSNPISKWMSGLSSAANPFNQIQITGLSKTDTGHLIQHFGHINLITVIPKLTGLANQYKDLSKKGKPLTAQDKTAYVHLFDQTMSLLQLKPTFYLGSNSGQKGGGISLISLLNQPALQKDQVHVMLRDSKTNQSLAQFVLKAKSPSPSTAVTSFPTKSSHLY